MYPAAQCALQHNVTFGTMCHAAQCAVMYNVPYHTTILIARAYLTIDIVTADVRIAYFVLSHKTYSHANLLVWTVFLFE
jgi:hypothetical protein